MAPKGSLTQLQQPNKQKARALTRMPQHSLYRRLQVAFYLAEENVIYRFFNGRSTTAGKRRDYVQREKMKRHEEIFGGSQ
jgi:hypothetical protein